MSKNEVSAPDEIQTEAQLSDIDDTSSAFVLNTSRTAGAGAAAAPTHKAPSTKEGSPARTKPRRRASERGDPGDLRNRVYRVSDLSAYRLSERLLIRTADLFFYLLIKTIGLTLRMEVKGGENLDHIHSAGHRAIFTFWHSCIFTATWLWRKRGIVVMSSQSRDGEFTGRFIKRFGYGTARGSSSRGAGRALAEMSACLQNGIDVAFTIDGPRGPAYVAKSGAITLARHTGEAILPFHITARRSIRLPSWDRLQIPLPFTRTAAFVGSPIYVSSESNSDQVNSKQEELQRSLDDLREQGEQWLRDQSYS
jgi:lysophospholipid acyltransferase (LPLAT)-like uncharacterized protein